jgi:tetratricopeptide (TPR) repeat protein
MDTSATPSSSQTKERWWQILTWEETCLIAIKYHRVLLGLAVALGYLFVQERLLTMDDRLFQPSIDGVRGLIQYQAGRYSRAAMAYRADLRTGGWQEWSTNDEAYTALLKGDLSQARRLADLQLGKEPAHADAWLTLGEVALEENNLKRAMDAFDHVVSFDSKHYDALLLSAIAHSRAGNINQAIDRLRQALRHNASGERITAYHWALQTAGDLRQDAPDGLQWCFLAHLYRYLRIFDPSNAAWARGAAIKAIDSGSRIDDAYITLGVLEDKTGNYDAALRYFLRAVEANRRNPEAYRWAASMYRHRGSDLLNEYQMWKGAHTASGLDGFYRDGLVAFLTERFGDYPQALKLAHQALDQDPQNKDMLRRVASLYQRLGKHDEAIRFYRTLLSLQPRDESAMDAIGYSLVSLERYEEAIASYQSALTINPSRRESHSGLGALYARQGRNADAIREYETALQIGGDDVDTRAFLCTQYWATNRYEDAEACLRHVLRQDPHNKSAMQIYPYVMKGLEHSRHER